MDEFIQHIGHKVQMVSELDIDSIPAGTIQKSWLHVVTDGIGTPVAVPVMVARGRESGPVLGLSAAIHGNEVNGIKVIQNLFRSLDFTRLSGTLIGILAFNVPSLLNKRRRFIDNYDLNHIMPGKEDGSVSEVYAFRVFHGIIKKCDYLLDLHTASFGRINSYYIRANMENEVTRRMAVLQNASIIVNNPPSDGTLRGAAVDIGIPAITLEIGDPNKFQRGMVHSGLTGINNLMIDLKMIEGEIVEPEVKAIECDHSFWVYCSEGGILLVKPHINEFVKEEDMIATQYDAFGEEIKKYFAPHDGIVIGKSVHPISQTGARILHLGIFKS